MEQQKQQQVQIRASDDDMKGRYSNGMRATHTKEEFIVDFVNIIPGTPPLGQLVSRVILSPAHCKRMLQALEENMKRYEDQFGSVSPAEAPKDSIGFRAE